MVGTGAVGSFSNICKTQNSENAKTQHSENAASLRKRKNISGYINMYVYACMHVCMCVLYMYCSVYILHVLY